LLGEDCPLCRRIFQHKAGLPAEALAKAGRGDCRNFEPARALAPFAGPFLGPVEPFILDADRLARHSA